MERISYQQTIELINELEKTFPVDQLIYNNINVWIFIKISITNRCILFQAREQTEHSVKKIKQRVGDVILTYTTLIKLKKGLKYSKKKSYEKQLYTSKNKIIYLSNSQHRTQIIDGKYWNPLSDSFASTVKEREDIEILEFSNSNQTNEPAFEKIIDANQLAEKAKYRRQKKILSQHIKAVFYSKKEGANSFPVKEFNKRIKELNLDRYFDYSEFCYEMEYILALRIELRNLFKKTTPKCIVFGVYYCLESYAGTLACKDLNIKSIEIQHGIYNKLFYNLPVKNYELLPNYFFSWNIEQSMIVNHWAKNKTYHQAFNYGICTLAFWAKNKSIFKNEHSDIIEQIRKANPSLKSVTFTFNESTEKQLASLIISSKKEVYWFLRLHPRIKSDNLDELIKELQKNNCNNYNIESATKTPLYPLLEQTDYHMTSSSSVVVEGLKLNIPSFIINEDGKIFYYDDYSKNPLVYFTRNNTEILEIIQQKEIAKHVSSQQLNIVFDDFLTTSKVIL